MKKVDDSTKGKKTLWEMEKIARYEQFPLFPQCFERLVRQTCKHKGFVWVEFFFFFFFLRNYLSLDQSTKCRINRMCIHRLVSRVAKLLGNRPQMTENIFGKTKKMLHFTSFAECFKIILLQSRQNTWLFGTSLTCY